MFSLKSTSCSRLHSHHLALLDALPAPVLLTDTNFTITYANKATMVALRKMAGRLPVPVEKIVGSPIGVFQNPPHDDGFLSMSATMLKNARGEFDGAFIDLYIN